MSTYYMPIKSYLVIYILPTFVEIDPRVDNKQIQGTTLTEAKPITFFLLVI